MEDRACAVKKKTNLETKYLPDPTFRFTVSTDLHKAQQSAESRRHSEAQLNGRGQEPTRSPHRVGLAGKVFTCLAKEGVSIEMMAQGASEINMSVVIAQEDMDKAIKAIHRDFLEDK